MTLFELFDKNIDAIRSMGERAVAEAHSAGVPAFYMDATLGSGIVRELPDGTRERIERRDGELVVIERYGPRR